MSLDKDPRLVVSQVTFAIFSLSRRLVGFGRLKWAWGLGFRVVGFRVKVQPLTLHNEFFSRENRAGHSTMTQDRSFWNDSSRDNKRKQ